MHVLPHTYWTSWCTELCHVMLISHHLSPGKIANKSVSHEVWKAEGMTEWICRPTLVPLIGFLDYWVSTNEHDFYDLWRVCAVTRRRKLTVSCKQTTAWSRDFNVTTTKQTTTLHYTHIKKWCLKIYKSERVLFSCLLATVGYLLTYFMS